MANRQGSLEETQFHARSVWFDYPKAIALGGRIAPTHHFGMRAVARQKAQWNPSAYDNL
jgi:hypothetical protein